VKLDIIFSEAKTELGAFYPQEQDESLSDQKHETGHSTSQIGLCWYI